MVQVSDIHSIMVPVAWYWTPVQNALDNSLKSNFFPVQVMISPSDCKRSYDFLDKVLPNSLTMFLWCSFRCERVNDCDFHLVPERLIDQVMFSTKSCHKIYLNQVKLNSISQLLNNWSCHTLAFTYTWIYWI